jgi:hypothetical protein
MKSNQGHKGRRLGLESVLIEGQLHHWTGFASILGLTSTSRKCIHVTPAHCFSSANFTCLQFEQLVLWPHSSLPCYYVQSTLRCKAGVCVCVCVCVRVCKASLTSPILLRPVNPESTRPLHVCVRVCKCMQAYMCACVRVGASDII